MHALKRHLNVPVKQHVLFYSNTRLKGHIEGLGIGRAAVVVSTFISCFFLTSYYPLYRYTPYVLTDCAQMTTKIIANCTYKARKLAANIPGSIPQQHAHEVNHSNQITNKRNKYWNETKS